MMSWWTKNRHWKHPATFGGKSRTRSNRQPREKLIPNEPRVPEFFSLGDNHVSRFSQHKSRLHSSFQERDRTARFRGTEYSVGIRYQPARELLAHVNSLLKPKWVTDLWKLTQKVGLKNYVSFSLFISAICSDTKSFCSFRVCLSIVRETLSYGEIWNGSEIQFLCFELFGQFPTRESVKNSWVVYPPVLHLSCCYFCLKICSVQYTIYYSVSRRSCFVPSFREATTRENRTSP